MSKIGKRTLIFHAGTTVTYENNTITVTGKHGELVWVMPKHNFTIPISKNSLQVLPPTTKKKTLADKCMWGTINARIKCMIDGITTPFVKNLKIVGVGFRCIQKGKLLTFKLGFSHDITLETPIGVSVTVLKQTNLTLSSPDKELLGSFSAKIRDLARPEPYLGKGIRYADEILKKKVGKRVGK